MNLPAYNLIRYEISDIIEAGNILETVRFYKRIFYPFRPNYQPIIEWMVKLDTQHARSIGLWIYPFNDDCYQIYLFDKKTRICGKYKPRDHHVYMIDTYMESTYHQRRGDL